MNRIKSDIEKQTFSRMYLLYGEDEYMRNLYMKRLKKELLGDGDEMNCSIFNGKDIDVDELISVAQTMPFFAPRRVIVTNNSEIFKSACSIPDYYDSFPDTTYFVFNENEADKRSRMYKLVKNKGYICEMKGLNADNLMGFIASRLGSAGINITKDNAKYILDKVGTDMYKLANECDKLIAYVGKREDMAVNTSDVDAICCITLENKIFEMIDDLAFGRRDMALKKYMDILALKEAPAKILRLITRHYSILYILYKGRAGGLDNDRLCKAAKIPSFALRKYMAQLGQYNEMKLKSVIEQCVDYEEKFKTGNMTDQIAVDILMCSI